MWIDRSITSRLLSVSKQFPAVLLTGARQTGKTSLLKHTFPKASYVSFDLPSIAEEAESNPDGFLEKLGNSPVILDEIQYVPKLFRHLKFVLDKERHAMGRLLMTGSQKFSLMKSLSESLAGRCAVLELDTLSAQEVRKAFSKDIPSLEDFLWKGGFPEIYRNPDLRPGEFFHAYVAAYLERDVRSFLRVGNLRDFERFIRSCALRSGQLVNFTDLARDIGVAATTIRDWISALEASNQVILVEPYFNNATKRMIKTPKLFFLDTGLLCFLLGLDSPKTLLNSPFIGPVWETYVLNQIVRAKASLGATAGIYFWRDAHGVEVDFVLENHGKLRLIEVKWMEEPPALKVIPVLEKVMGQLKQRAASEHWVACRTAHDHYLKENPAIRYINAYKFHDWLA